MPSNIVSVNTTPRYRRGSRRFRVHFLGAREPRIENLPDFAIGHALLVSALGVVSHDAAPERHGDGIAQVLGDLPAACEPVEYELDCELADAATAKRPSDEEFGHAVIHGRPAAFSAALRHDGETHGFVAPQDDQRIYRKIPEPARELVGGAVA